VTRPFRVAALAWPVGRDEAFATTLSRWCEAARAAEADVLLLPEYAPCETAFAGRQGAAEERDAAAEAAPSLLAALEAAASRHGLWIAGGTLLRRGARGIVNACPLVSPAGLAGWQEKHCRTRFEREAWGLAPGGFPSVFATPWGRLGIAVCYDVEFPPLVRAQVLAGADVILVPACTDSAHGAARVTLSARARAIENQCIIAVAPTVGAAPWCESLDANTGQAGIYGPADHGFPADGVLAERPMGEPGLAIATIAPAAIAAVRRDGAVTNHADWPTTPIPPCPVIAEGALVP
jgi:predicted amidohydrolase